MKKSLITILFSITFFACDSPKNGPSKSTPLKDSIYHDLDLSKIDTTDYLIRKSDEDPNYELGVPFAFINKKMIPLFL